nr:anti-sigma factor [uncultured Flavobacterium sp.]
MTNEDEKLDQLFAKFDSDWDVLAMPNNHESRFTDKLNNKTIKNRKRNLYTTISIAATILMMFSLSFFFKPEAKTNTLTFASKETKQTDSIFTVLIKHELNKLKEKKSSQNQKIITDALEQMKILDNDYQKIIKEIATNGENKQIIYAMISNLQTRISFLQNVLTQIEATEQLNTQNDEKTL